MTESSEASRSGLGLLNAAHNYSRGQVASKPLRENVPRGFVETALRGS